MLQLHKNNVIVNNEFTYPKFMNRITNKDVEFQLERLNKLTNNPTDMYAILMEILDEICKGGSNE